ncbi:MAG: hypothetical protein IIW01_10360, partial [Thermoguttaceae bacterium]|nr:hypothetical protein [Thermoguttaceae bacterium]
RFDVENAPSTESFQGGMAAGWSLELKIATRGLAKRSGAPYNIGETRRTSAIRRMKTKRRARTSTA